MMQFYIPEVLGVVQVEDETDQIAKKEFEKFEEKIKNSKPSEKQTINHCFVRALYMYK